jgi:hypothetical protein
VACAQNNCLHRASRTPRSYLDVAGLQQPGVQGGADGSDLPYPYHHHHVHDQQQYPGGQGGSPGHLVPGGATAGSPTPPSYMGRVLNAFQLFQPHVMRWIAASQVCGRGGASRQAGRQAIRGP